MFLSLWPPESQSDYAVHLRERQQRGARGLSYTKHVLCSIAGALGKGLNERVARVRVYGGFVVPGCMALGGPHGQRLWPSVR